MSWKTESSNKRIKMESVAMVAIAIGLFFYFTRPLWHWLFFSFLYRKMVFLLVTMGLIVAAIGLIRKEIKRYQRRFRYISDGRYAWIVAKWILLCFVPWLGVQYLSIDTYGRSLAYSFEPEMVQGLPETTNIRYTPYEVSLAFANARQENPTKQVGDIDPVEINGEFHWLAPRIPHGIANWLLRQTDGILLVNEDGGVEFQPQLFKCGEGMGITDSIAWKLFSKRFGAEYPEIFYLEIDGVWTGMAPYVTYEFYFPVFVPKWGGVMLVHPDGRIEDLSPAQAQADPRLTGQRLFPEALARAYSLKWGYRFGGLWNILWFHHEQVEVADLVGTENEMPYYLPTTWGPQWMMAVEPSGPSQSIFKIFWFDAHSGKARLTEFREKAFVGPNRGASFAKSETSGYVWVEEIKEGWTGTYLVIEPRPIVREGTLYWQYSVTPRDYTGVGLTILVNSLDTEDVIHFCSRKALMRWLVGEGKPDSLPCERAVEPVAPTPVAVPRDLGEMTEEEIYDLIRQALDELERRQ